MKTSLRLRVILFASLLTLGGIVPAASAQEPFLGEIRRFGFNFAPAGWAMCDGQILSINQNQALYSLLGTTYGGDGRTTFGLPEMRGRVAIHEGNVPGLGNFTLGQKGGSNTHTLSVTQMPSHTHTMTLKATTASNANQIVPTTASVLGKYPRARQYSNQAPDVTLSAASIEVANTGSGQSFSITQPYLAVTHCIALNGFFPSRN